MERITTSGGHRPCDTTHAPKPEWTMAEQNRNRDDQIDENARKASGASSSSGNTGNRGRDQSQTRDQNAAGEPDDVAEDRNLSGSSTWLNLPDHQPSGDENTDDDSSRERGQSNR